MTSENPQISRRRSYSCCNCNCVSLHVDLLGIACFITSNNLGQRVSTSSCGEQIIPMLYHTYWRNSLFSDVLAVSPFETTWVRVPYHHQLWSRNRNMVFTARPAQMKEQLIIIVDDTIISASKYPKELSVTFDNIFMSNSHGNQIWNRSRNMAYTA